MNEHLTSPIFAALGQLNDVELDRLHVICGFSAKDSRLLKMCELCASTAHIETITNYLNLNRHQLHPNMKKGKVAPEPDHKMCFELSKHHNAIPLILYLGTFKLKQKEMFALLEKYFHFNTTLIPEVANIKTIIEQKYYPLSATECIEQSGRIRKVAEAYGLKECDIFYDPLHFDSSHESQGGWGIEFTKKLTELYGFSMISGDTVESTIAAIPAALQSGKKRVAAKR